MSRKGSAQKPPVTPFTSFKKVSYRELSTGKLESTRDVKFLLKLDHLQQLAAWASGEACIPSLGAYLGNLYADTAETMAAEPDPTVISCGRCETILHPGINCTVRVEKNQAKRKHRYKNNVVYKCHFCSHASQKRGTPSNYYMREVCQAKGKPSSESQASNSKINKSCSGNKSTTSKDSKITKPNGITLSATPGDIAIANSPANPSAMGAITLLDSMKRKDHKITYVNGIALPATPGDMAIANSPANPSAMGANPLHDSMKRKDHKVTYVNGMALPATPGDISIANSRANPSVAGGTPLLDAMKRKRKRSQVKIVQTPQSNSAATNVEGTASSSGRRKRKQPKTMWESLKNKFEQRDRQSNQRSLRQGRPGNRKLFLF